MKQLWFCHCTAVAYSSLLTKYGCRIVALIGTLLASLGYISSSFTTSVTQLYFTYGIVSGEIPVYNNHSLTVERYNQGYNHKLVSSNSHKIDHLIFPFPTNNIVT